MTATCHRAPSRAAAATLLLAGLWLIAGGCSQAPSAMAPPPSPTALPAAPAATATPPPPPEKATAVPTLPLPGSLPISAVEPPLVRVLLERSQSSILLPQPGRAYRVRGAEVDDWVWGPVTVSSSSERVWQVGAWQDVEAAAAAAQRLEQGLGEIAAVSRETTEGGLLRVRVRWAAGSEPADAGLRLAALGFADAFATAAATSVELRGAAAGVIRAAGELLLEPAGDWPTAVGTRRYRGRFVVRAVADGILLINELNLESYLAGVVPVEMGPYQFPELEALKAQAVAARTYAAAHLGDHADEGWDLCATPACQAYHGADAEHPLSNRAVEETAGLVVAWQGLPIDAMYTSTCGGHTEAAVELFPDRAQPYLQGVLCAWERGLVLNGRPAAGGWIDQGRFEAAVARMAIGLEAGEPGPSAVIARVATLCNGSAGGAIRDVETAASALLAAAGLRDAAEVLAGGGDGLDRLLELTDLVEVELAPPVAGWQDEWLLRAALAVLEVQGVVVRDRGEAVPHPGGVAIYPRRGDSAELLPAALPLYRRWADSYQAVASAVVAPGTGLERLRRGDQVLALVVVRSGGDAEADRRSAWRSWVRERTFEELATTLGVAELERLVVTRRSPSGRVVGLVAEGRSGERREWSGFGVRRALDLPENLFSFHRLERGDGRTVLRFIGRGWGHGVGLCQNGAYGLARAGRRFDEILTTYYSGVEVVRFSP